MSRRLVVEADGGSRGNPGPAGFGALVRDAGTGAVLAEVAEPIGVATNNVAEYRGLLAGLRTAAQVDPDAEVEVRMDSRLVVEQMSGRWQVRDAALRLLADQARAVLPPSRVSYTWVPRGENAAADRLANAAMDAAATAAPAPAPATTPALVGGDGAPTTLLVVRHGRTSNTEAGRFAGRTGEDPPLSARGEREAARLGGLVATLGDGGSVLPDVPRPDVVVASPMRRTRQTAAAAASALGLDPDADVALDDGWVEASFGAWENLTYAEIAAGWPAELAAWHGSPTVAPPDGDALADVAARVADARRRTVSAHLGRAVLVVTHATCVRAVVQEALAAGDPAPWRLRVSPAAVTVVRYWPDGGVEVVTVNATAHLAGL